MVKVLSLIVVTALTVGAWGAYASGYVAIPVAAGVSLACFVLLAVTSLLRRPRHADRVTPMPDERLLSARVRTSESKRTAIRDDATGLYTRWYFEQRLTEEGARCLRYDHSMAVIVLRTGLLGLGDISNDDWQSRTEVAARYCTQVVRNVDMSAALGPFEFAICLVHCDRDGADKVVKRLEGELAEYGCETAVALFPKDANSPGQLIELAQSRLRKLAA